MNNVLLFLCFSCSVFSGILILLLTSYYCKLKYRVDDLEKQIENISKTSAEFFCAINNRITDISTVYDCCDTNIDTLFDENDKINESLTALKRSVECVNCKLQNPFDSPHLVFFSKRRDKNG